MDNSYGTQIAEDMTSAAAGTAPAAVNGDAAVESKQVEMMEKEIREQEQLLAGYQQENERIYQVRTAGGACSKNDVQFS